MKRNHVFNPPAVTLQAFCLRMYMTAAYVGMFKQTGRMQYILLANFKRQFALNKNLSETNDSGIPT
jgi:hypothetical protein